MIFVVLAGLDSVPATANTQSRTAARNARAYEKSGHLLYEHALALYNRKNPEDMRAALPFFRRAAEDFRAAGAHGKQAGALLGAGFVLRHLGYDREALRHFTGALLLYRRVKHRPGEVDALLNIGATHFSLQDSEKSLDHFNEALALARRIRER
ncbi:MAG TPA: tetratricopeptide repeat protein, partial [Blastocatellia bacterium]|nr:tetratricopeptide repeat protein [Blastocatellia bacterium]